MEKYLKYAPLNWGFSLTASVSYCHSVTNRTALALAIIVGFALTGCTAAAQPVAHKSPQPTVVATAPPIVAATVSPVNPDAAYYAAVHPLIPDSAITPENVPQFTSGICATLAGVTAPSFLKVATGLLAIKFKATAATAAQVMRITATRYCPDKLSVLAGQ